MAAHVLHQGLAFCGSTAWARRMGGGDYEGRVEPWAWAWEWKWARACGRLAKLGCGGLGAAPDETQPATRAKRAETDKSDGTPA